MAVDIIDLDGRLLNDFQRNVPLTARPFAAMAEVLETTEGEVIARLRKLMNRGTITRFGATCRPNTAGSSTLAAVAAPEWDVEKTAAIINAQPGVNHSYLREHHWNIWFVVTGPNRAHLDSVLKRITNETGLRVLDLPLVEPFNIDLGFDLNGVRAGHVLPLRPSPSRELMPVERALMQVLSAGLPLAPRPFKTLAESCGVSEDEAIERTATLVEDGFVTRFGVIVRHRALGWRSNAMVVWQLPPERASTAGPSLAKVPGVTLCYRRRAVPGIWPYTLYNMIHGRSRADAETVLAEARALPELRDVPHEVLFSLRCFRQTGALIDTVETEVVE